MKNNRIQNRPLLDTFHAMNCVVCGRRGCDPAHIVSRGAGGDDVELNLMALCRKHHVEQHSIGWNKMSEKHQSVNLDLESKGWVFNSFNKLVKK